MVATVHGMEPLRKRMRAEHRTSAEKHSSVVAGINREKRLHNHFNYLVRVGVCLSLRDISSVLGQSVGTQMGTTCENAFVRRLQRLLKDEALKVLVHLIHQTVRSDGSYVLDAHVKLNFVKYGFLKGGHAPETPT